MRIRRDSGRLTFTIKLEKLRGERGGKDFRGSAGHSYGTTDNSPTQGDRRKEAYWKKIKKAR